jgi:hypothetical protein
MKTTELQAFLVMGGVVGGTCFTSLRQDIKTDRRQGPHVRHGSYVSEKTKHAS